ncbi:hypothetical protein MCUN1_001005 [Malassezia cuniculi]|uniref:COP9 signalosome complex subunit 4 n=1 Tax=Malassezia cuniculi TaxID=948313 RepID=A0AAF0J5F8_9BASI|nr:hypothetical protein MCUN1_001005 [Malassezia cuniculi]
MDVDERLNTAANEPSLDARAAVYEEALRAALACDGDVTDTLIAIIEHATHHPANSRGVGLVVARRTLNEFIQLITTAHAQQHGYLADTSCFRAMLERALEVTAAVSGLVDEVVSLRLTLASALAELGDKRGAADVYADVINNAPRRSDTDVWWMRLHIQLIELLLSIGDPAAADTFLKRALVLVHSVDDKQVAFDFRRVQASVYDAQHRYCDAAVIYYEQSVEAQDAQLLSAAVNSALVAPVSAQRTLLLEQLARDSRAASLPQAPVLTLAANGRMLRAADRALLETHLAPHQRHVVLGTDMFRSSELLRVVDVAVAEHNISAASRVYSVVKISRLADLTGFSPADIEAQVGRMITRGALPPGTLIDQVAGSVSYGEPVHPVAAAESQEETEATTQEEPFDPDASLYAGWCARIASCTQTLEQAHERLHAAGWLASGAAV